MTQGLKTNTLWILGLALSSCGRPAADVESCCSGTSARLEEAANFDDVPSYLLQRYDSDQDGRVTPDEYDRTPAAFARLDRNRDGVLNSRDFEEDRERRAGKRQAERAKRVIARHFQTDEDLTTVAGDELEWAFGEFDVDGDDRLDEEEFRCGATARLRPLPGDSSKEIAKLLDRVDPWLALLQVLDEDRDKAIARGELQAFYEAGSEKGGWVFDGDVSDASGEDQRALRPLLGQMAPDFTLTSTEGEEVTLSELRGNPVALIFGSYT